MKEGTMAYYSDELIEEVRSRNDVVDVISGYVRLQKKGSTYFGLCPFHNENDTVVFGVAGKTDVLLFWMRSRWKCIYLYDAI